MANTNRQGCLQLQSSYSKEKRWISTYGLFFLAFLFVFAATNFIANWVDLAQAIGDGGTNYILENLKMKRVYDYMFHLLNSYSELLKFKPIIPVGSVEICSEGMACSLHGRRKHFMVESMVTSPSDTPPCTMPPPYTPETLKEFF